MPPLIAGADLTWHSASRLTFTTATHDRYVITGTDLHWGKAGLDAGSIDALTFRDHDAGQITFANLQTTGSLLWAALQAGRDGTGPTALTNLLVRHCWT